MKKILLNKKGQVQSIAPAILALLFAAIVLVFVLIMTQSMRDTPIVQVGTAAATIVNESVAFNVTPNVATIDLAKATEPGALCSVSQVRNGTVGGLINSGNYTISACSITNLTSTYSAVDWKVDYSWTRGGEAYISANKTITGLATFADFWEIIVLAIVITVVIGLLLVVFGGRSRR